MKEANFQTMFGKHLKITKPVFSSVFELKIVKNDKPFAFSAVKKQQIEGLKEAKIGTYLKISDSPIFNGMKTRFTNPKKFDCLWIKSSESFVVVFFYHPRKEKFFYTIEIDDFMKLKETWKRKSIHEDELMTTGLARKIKLIIKD